MMPWGTHTHTRNAHPTCRTHAYSAHTCTRTRMRAPEVGGPGPGSARGLTVHPGPVPTPTGLLALSQRPPKGPQPTGHPRGDKAPFTRTPIRAHFYGQYLASWRIQLL